MMRCGNTEWPSKNLFFLFKWIGSFRDAISFLLKCKKFSPFAFFFEVSYC